MTFSEAEPTAVRNLAEGKVLIGFSTAIRVLCVICVIRVPEKALLERG